MPRPETKKPNHFLRLLAVMALVLSLWDLHSSTSYAQRRAAATRGESLGPAIPPVRVGDQIEVKSGFQWYPGKVLSFSDGTASVEYQWGSLTSTRDFTLDKMRFPNGEGHWMVWKDASGKHEIIARYISRTATEVTIRKEDGNDVSLPISALAPALRKQLAQTPITGQENMIDGANPIRVGDQVQVKYAFTWYDGVVKQVMPGLAKVEYQYGSTTRTIEAKLEDIRFPNGEGRWREWSDASGEIKIIARYLYRDDTHVTIRKEDDTDVRVEIARLSPKLRRLLAETPIIAPRPPRVSFATSSTRNISMDSAPNLQSLALATSAAAEPIHLKSGGFGFPIPLGDSISTAIAIGGSEQWVAVGTYAGSWMKGPRATQLFWASPAGHRVVDGPVFLEDERIVEYSAAQSRLITVQVGGRWNTPKRFCSYRVAPGGSLAKAEASWDIPEPKWSTSRQAAYLAKLVGDHQLLLASDNTASLFDFANRRIEYTIDGLASNHFRLHPGGKHFVIAIKDGGHSIHEIASGARIAHEPSSRNSRGAVGFSQDGRYLLRADSQGINVWDITQDKPPASMRRGGLSVSENTPLSLLSGGWICAGSQFYSTGLKLVVWSYVGSGVSIAHREMLGRQMLAVGTAGSYRGPKTALVGVATVPHQDAVKLMAQVDPDSLLMLERGAPLKIVASGNAKIAAGLRRAAAANGWREDPSSDVVLTGSAGLGEAEKRTYQKTSFGRSGGSTIEEHTVQPWIQSAEIRYQDKVAWSIRWGGVPYSLFLREGQSLGSELQKSSNPSYELFDQLTLPEELLYPRYQKGLGKTEITPTGFVDKAN